MAARRPLLANAIVHAILREEWCGLNERHGWCVGRYVVMPDHVHFFATSVVADGKPLAIAIGKWKEWTAKRILSAAREVTESGGPITSPIWQREFFDHVLRSSESRSEKWDYVRKNPVRAGLVATPEDWPFAGAIHFE